MRTTWPGRVSLILALTVGIFLAVSGSTGAGIDWHKYLKSDQTTDVTALLKRNKEATEKDRRLAQGYLKEASAYAKRQEWDGAAISYGTSIQIYPTVEGLLLYSVSRARIDRPRYTCEEESSWKLNDLTAAVVHFRTALKFHHRLGRKSNVSLETVEKFLRELFAAEKNAFVNILWCLKKRAR